TSKIAPSPAQSDSSLHRSQESAGATNLTTSTPQHSDIDKILVLFDEPIYQELIEDSSDIDKQLTEKIIEGALGLGIGDASAPVYAEFHRDHQDSAIDLLNHNNLLTLELGQIADNIIDTNDIGLDHQQNEPTIDSIDSDDLRGATADKLSTEATDRYLYDLIDQWNDNNTGIQFHITPADETDYSEPDNNPFTETEDHSETNSEIDDPELQHHNINSDNLRRPNPTRRNSYPDHERDTSTRRLDLQLINRHAN